MYVACSLMMTLANYYKKLKNCLNINTPQETRINK